MFQVLPHRGGKQKVSNKQVLDSEEMLSPIPSGKHTKNYGKSPCYSWENSRFLW